MVDFYGGQCGSKYYRTRPMDPTSDNERIYAALGLFGTQGT